MKKAFLLLLAACVFACLPFSFVGCNEAQEPQPASSVSSTENPPSAPPDSESDTASSIGDVMPDTFDTVASEGDASNDISQGSDPLADSQPTQDSEAALDSVTKDSYDEDNDSTAADSSSTVDSSSTADSSNTVDSSATADSSSTVDSSSAVDSSNTVDSSSTSVGSTAEGSSTAFPDDGGDWIRATITDLEWEYNLSLTNYRVDLGTYSYGMAANGVEMLSDEYDMLMIYEDGYTYTYVSMGTGYILTDKAASEPYVPKSIGTFLFGGDTIPFESLTYNTYLRCYIWQNVKFYFTNGLLVSAGNYVFTDHNSVVLEKPKSENVNIPLAPSDFDSTISRESWDKLLEMDNFKATTTLANEKGTLIYTKDGAYISYSGLEMYIAPKNGVTYSLVINPFTGEKAVSLYDSEYSISGILFSGLVTKESYSSLEFNEEKGCFTLCVSPTDSQETDEIVYEIYFIDGSVVYIVETQNGSSELSEISNIGQTTLEIPDFLPAYTENDLINWPASESPTVTEDEWRNAFTSNNFMCSIYSEGYHVCDYTVTDVMANCADSLLIEKDGKVYNVFQYGANLYGVETGLENIDLNRVLFGNVDYSCLFNEGMYDGERGAYILVTQNDEVTEEMIIYFDSALISMIYVTETNKSTGEVITYSIVFGSYGEIDEVTAPEFEIVDLNN